MSTYYQLALDEVCDQIKHYSPAVIPVLEQLRLAYSAQIAYYAGFILVCLNAQQGSGFHQALDTLTQTDLRDFTFFETIHDDPRAIALFDELLRTFVSEHSLPPPDAGELLDMREWDVATVASFYVNRPGDEQRAAGAELYRRGFLPIGKFPYYMPRLGRDPEGKVLNAQHAAAGSA